MPRPNADTLYRYQSAAGFLGLLLMSVGVTLGPAPQNLGLALALLAFATTRDAWRWVGGLPELHLGLALAVLILAAAAYAAHTLPDTASEQWDQATSWLKLLLFIPLAWFVRSERHTALALAFSAGVLLSAASASWEQWFLGEPWPARFGGQLGKPIVFGFYALVALLIIVGHFPAVWSRMGSVRRRAAALVLAGGSAAYLVWVLLATASRGPILTAIVSLTVLAATWARWAPRPFRLSPGRLLVAALALILLLGVFQEPLKLVVERFRGEADSLVAAFSPEDSAEDVRDNTSIRLAQWRFAVAEWSRRPVFGAGPGSVEYLEMQDGHHLLFDSVTGQPYDHLHSAYFQVLFAYGLAGLTLISLLMGLLARRILLAWRGGAIDGSQLSALLAGAAAIAAYSITDFRHLNHDWRAFWIVSAAVVLGLGSRKRT